MLHNIWAEVLDTNKDGEIAETRFFKFLRTNRICQDRNLVDEMYKQVLILHKDEQAPKKGVVNKAMFFRLFEKPLMLIPMENALNFISKEESAVDKHPEADQTAAGRTLATVDFQRQYMKQVFSHDRTSTSDQPTDPHWRENFRSKVVDRTNTIELMAKMAIDKSGLTQEAIVKNVQYEIERVMN